MIKTVSLETAKALKDAGFKQETQFTYSFDEGYSLGITGVSLFGQPTYASPTIDEILEELPFFYHQSKFLTIRKLHDHYSVGYMMDEDWRECQEDASLPEALAKLISYCKHTQATNQA